MGIIKKLFKSDNDRALLKLQKVADEILALEEKYQQLTDKELKACTDIFKARLSEGETLEDLLPDAFASIREASARVLEMKHFPIQIVGGIALHEGRIAEMRTGEGKTLVATLPAYLNALTGKGVHVVTVNDYLASRDAAWMGKVYMFMGLSVGIAVSGMTGPQKREAFHSDITYCTNTELGFDYLRDNMAVRKEDKVQRELNYAILDEVDSILIDEARTPLIISGRGTKSSDIYIVANRFARSLTIEEDFVIDDKEKAVRLNESGIEKAEKFFKLENLSDIENTEINHHINIALKANHIMKRDGDYLINDGEVMIIDQYTGRLMIGRRYSNGLHQAIEAKERVKIKDENKTYATITYQNFFRNYERLSGMTGTAMTEREEFRNTYGIDVIEIPTNKPCQRNDENDQLYKTEDGKIKAIIKDIQERNKKGQPVLVGTVTVEKSEALSLELKRLRIKHNVLNAKNHAKEAEIISQAGKKAAVTIATNMAGRGTDIMLGGNPDHMARKKLSNLGYPDNIISYATSHITTEDNEILKAREEYDKYLKIFRDDIASEKEEVITLGGLRIIGTERHDSRRIDNQLRGRSGRQGDPGSSIFYISMDDTIARVFGGDRLRSLLDMLNIEDDMAISNKIITKQIERAQSNAEGRNYSIRKNVLSYDDVLNKQRENIYIEREKILQGQDVHDEVVKMIPDLAQPIIEEFADYAVDYYTWDYELFNTELEKYLLPVGTNFMTSELASCYDVYKLLEAVTQKAEECYKQKIEEYQEQGINFSEVERVIMLKTVDKHWIDHIDQMDFLRKGIGLRAYGQRDPVSAFKQEGFEMFDNMVERIRREVVGYLMKAVITKNAPPKAESNLSKISSDGKNAPVSSKEKIGRNSPCPCGSGKKYKNCCLGKEE